MINTPGYTARSQASYRFTLARVDGEARLVSVIAETANRTEEQVRSAIRKVRKQNEGVVKWVRLCEVLGV